jgi:hypothetical protein
LAEIDSKELLKEFTNATWHSTPEMNEFVRRAIAQGEFPIKKAYEIMNENGHISNPAIFKKRIYCFELIANTVKKPSTAEFFLGVLISSPGPIQTALLRVLKEINDPEWHPHAVKLLNHKDGAARKVGKELCCLIGGKTMFQYLEQQLRNRALPLRQEVLDTWKDTKYDELT